MQIYLKNLSLISYFLYYIRNNIENQYVSSLVSILKENGDQYYKMFLFILTDLINKGKKLATFFPKYTYKIYLNKNRIGTGFEKESDKNVLSIKNKYFIVVILLIIRSIFL